MLRDRYGGEGAATVDPGVCSRMRNRSSAFRFAGCGRPVVVDYRPSFVDGIASKTVFPGMLNMARRLVDGVIVVTLEEAASAIRFVAERARVLAEGAAACAVAAAVIGRAGKGKVAAIVSGGNIDLHKFCELCR